MLTEPIIVGGEGYIQVPERPGLGIGHRTRHGRYSILQRRDLVREGKLQPVVKVPSS